MIGVEEARARILAGLSPAAAETVALPDAWNRVLARPVAARLTQPPAPMSAMDGYAVRAADAQVGASLPVVGTAPAGRPWAGTLPLGAALRLFTGSVVPAGADCIVIQEDVSRNGERITVNAAGVAGRHIRAEGQDFRTGQVLLHPGRRLTARDIGLAAAANHPWLTVHARPRVALLATGDEIAMPGEPLAPGGIVSSNTHALAALIRAGGGEPVLLPIAPDDRDAIAAIAATAATCHMLVTTGGASVGDHDLIQSALAPHGLELDFWKIAMRPGKPLIHGRLGAVPLLGLPGNPVSALVCATLFLLPALAVLAGEAPRLPATERLPLAAALPANDGRTDFMRGKRQIAEDGTPTAVPFADQASSLLLVLAEADMLMIRPAHAPAAAAGELIEIIPLAQFGV